MRQLIYVGNGQRNESNPELENQKINRYRRPQDYIAEPGLVNAVNVALLLNKPLLLTGEPGTGKSQLAYSLAWELGFPEPLKYETKSTSTAKDLFYVFDTVGRFKSTRDQPALEFLTYSALGKAILFANDEMVVAKYLGRTIMHGGKRRSVVLIDEVDKAPRDFPNDILNELEYLHFSIPELGNEMISIDEDYRPIVVVTSPNRTTLQNIVTRRLGEFVGSSSVLLVSALDLFYRLREGSSQLRKNPATSELLDWLLALRTHCNGSDATLTRGLVDKTISSLVKTAEDQDKAQMIVEKWFSRK
jgi:hypothetical protein